MQFKFNLKKPYRLIFLGMIIFIVSFHVVLLNELHSTTTRHRNHNHKYCNHTSHIFFCHIYFVLQINNTDAFLKIRGMNIVLRICVFQFVLVHPPMDKFRTVKTRPTPNKIKKKGKTSRLDYFYKQLRLPPTHPLR